MAYIMQTPRKGSGTRENMMSRSSSGFGEDNFNFRPDTAPGNPRDQRLPVSPLVIGERSKSVPLNVRMSSKYAVDTQVKKSAREILQEGSANNSEEMRPKTVEPKVEETLLKDQPWYMLMLREKEERLLQMGDELNRLGAFEIAVKQKDNEIYDLRGQLAQYVATKTTQATEFESTTIDLKLRLQLLSDEILRLAPFEDKYKDGQEVIPTLLEKIEILEKESLERVKTPVAKQRQPSILLEETISVISDFEKVQISTDTYDEEVLSIRESLRSANADADALGQKFDKLAPEKMTPEDEVFLMKDALLKNAEIIQSLEKQVEDLQKELRMNEGFVNAVQKDLQISENKVMKMTSQVEKAEARMNEAIADAQAMSKKFSDLKESRKHSDMTAEAEHEMTLLKTALIEMKKKNEKMKEKIDKQSKEIRDSHRKVKKGNELDKKQSTEIKNLCKDLEDMRRREQLSRVACEQISSRFERLRSRIIQAVFITPGAARPDSAISDIVVYNAVNKIVEDRSEFHKKIEETNPDFPPLQIEIDASLEEDKVEDAGTNSVPAPERKSGKGGRKSPKHR